MSCHENGPLTCHAERSEASGVGHAASLVTPDASLPLSMTCRGHFFMAWHAMTNTSGGPLVPGRRPAAPLPTTNQSRPCVVGRGAAGLRPGNHPNQPSPRMLRCAQHDTREGLFYGMPL